MKFVGRVVNSTGRFDKSPYNKKTFLPVGLKATTTAWKGCPTDYVMLLIVGYAFLPVYFDVV